MAMSNILRLRPAFSDEQVQALAGLFDEELATKADLERLRIATKADLDAFRVEMKADVEKLRLEVQRALKGTEARMIGWVIGQGATIVGVLFALLHFIGK